jgi:ParB family chromosome partitioning protein
MMTQATVSASDRRARFVGEEAYVAAGGRVEKDLFSDDASTRWLDIALLERLACEKMEAIAAAAAAEQGLAFVRPTLDSWIGHEQTAGLRRVPIEAPSLSDAESARVDELEGEIEELVDLLQDDETVEPEREAAEAKIRELSDQIDAVVNKPPVIDEVLKARVGTFLTLDEQGRPTLGNSFYEEVRPGDAVAEERDAADGLEAEAKPGRRSGLSQRLVDELAMQRRDILAVHVAADPGLALDLAIFLMIDRKAGYSSEKSGSSLIAMPPPNPVCDFKTPDAAATMAREQAAETLDQSWTDRQTRAERFDAFRELADDARAAWLGHAVARTLEASLNLAGDRFCGFHNHLGQLLGIDAARWWRPTGANYFDRVPKSVTLAALEEVGGAALAGRYAKAKKAELAQSCERIFSGDFIAEVEVKDAALAWVPEVMRFGPAGPHEAAAGVAAEIDSPLPHAAAGDAAPEDRPAKVGEAA